MKNVLSKKMVSVLLAALMVCGLTIPAFAAGAPYGGYETVVSYTGTAQEEYTVTVPATLAPGGSGTVKANGTWDTTRQLNVTAPDSVVLMCDLDASDTKTLTVTGGDITLAGDNTVAVSKSVAISVADISDALFGTWTGTIVYSVAMSDI